MSCRQSELSLDAAAIRSIWEDGYSPAKSYGPTTAARMGFTSHRSYSGAPMMPAAGSERRSPSTFGPVGSPLRKKSLGAYDCSSGPFMSNAQSAAGYTMDSTLSPKRGSVSSLWDYSSGYSTGQQSPLFQSRNSFSDYSPELSPPSPSRVGSSSLFESLDQLSALEKDNEKEQLNMIAKAISSLLMTRGNSISDRVDTIKELFSLTTAGSRRASVACSGGHFLERERRVNNAATQPGTGATGTPAHLRSQLHGELSHSGHRSYPSALTGGGGAGGGGGSGNGSSSLFVNSQQTNNEMVLESIEREAKMRRTSAYQSETNFTWKGTLATRFHASPTYASKVFVGGLPYDVTPDALTELFGKFGLVTVQFPPRGRGHAYLVFDTEQQVQALLNACENKGPGQYFLLVSSRRGKDRLAQVIPWIIEDSDWAAPIDTSSDSTETPSESETGGSKSESSPVTLVQKKSPEQNNAYKQNTVFVGALHGEITAEGLQKILSDLFGPIAHVGIDTDRARYPNGSGRVTFVTRESFRRAVLAEFVQVVTPRFSKIIQLDAYIEDGICSECKAGTPIFCRHPSCFCYYCPMCFEKHRRDMLDYHPPVMRNRNNGPNNVNPSSSLHGNSRLNKDRSQTI